MSLLQDMGRKGGKILSKMHKRRRSGQVLVCRQKRDGAAPGPI